MLTEHVVVGGVALNTLGAWVTDMSDFHSSPQLRGADVLVPHLEGVQARRRFVDVTRRLVPLVVHGRYDLTGALSADRVQQLHDSLDALKVAWRPRMGDTGTMTLRHVLPDGSIRTAPCHALSFTGVLEAQGLYRAVLELSIPGGVLRATVPDTATRTGPGTLTVPNTGTADQFEATIELTGGPVTLTNTSWPGNPWLSYSGSDPVTINTGSYNARLVDDTFVGGLIDHSGHEQWLPLEPTDNEITVDAPAGVDVTVTHYPPFL